MKTNKCFVIAEAGSNHNGSLDQAKALINIASDAGADAVKFQLFKASTLYPNKPTKVKYLKNAGITQDLYELIRTMEVPSGWLAPLAEHAAKRGIEFMASPFDLHAVRLLNPYVKRFKVASFECLYGDLIDAIKETGKELLISIGGCSVKEVDLLVETKLRDYRSKTVLMHCLSKYPAPLNEIQLQVIPTLAKRYGIRMGYSDHTLDPILAPSVAVALGAVAIEKHYTASRYLPGPDHPFAIEPNELRHMVERIRQVSSSLGDPIKSIQPCEKELYFYKRVLYAKHALPKGRAVKKSDFVVLRNLGDSCHFLHPVEIDTVAGRRLRRAKKKGSILTWEDVAS